MDPEVLKELKDPVKQAQKLEELFNLLDKDKKGYLVPDEVKKGLKEKFGAAGVPILPDDKEREAEFLKAADPNNTGKVTLDGLKAAAKAHREKVKQVVNDPAKLEAEAKKIFGRLDLKKQGFLDVAHLEEVDKKLLAMNLPGPKVTPEHKEKLKKLADPTGSGKITEEGFVNMAKTVVAKLKEQGLFD